jgi:SAM-dependent methyltransferase
MNDLDDKIKHCYSTWGKTYYDDYYGEGSPYPPVHRDLLIRILHEHKVGDLLDAGCGPASFLRDIVGQGIGLYGFDITPEMVEEGKSVFLRKGVPSDRIWCGSVLDRDSYQYPSNADKKQYDAVISVGVMPHIPADKDVDVVRNVYSAVKDKGLAVIEARNQFFALFSQNRYSYDFIINDLIRADELRASAANELPLLENAFEEMKDRLCMDLPPIRKGKQNEPGYDEILSRTHNPYIFEKQFREVGFRDTKIYFYHYHCLPPMYKALLPEYFTRESMKMEDPEDWRGHFMASAFMILGKK